MENDEASPISKTPIDNEHDQYATSRRSSTSLSIVGVGGTPADLRHMNVYDVRSVNSPISPAVHPRCRTTTDFTTTERATQATTTPCPPSQLRTECTPMCARSPPCQQCTTPACQQCSPPPTQRSPPCMSVTPQCTTKSPTCTTKSPTCTTKSPDCVTRATQCTTRATQYSEHAPRAFDNTTRSPFIPCGSPQAPCGTRSPQYTTRSPSCPTRSPQCSSHTTRVNARTPGPRPVSMCSRGTSPQCPRTPTACHRNAPQPRTTCTPRSPTTCTPRSPTCTATTQCTTPRSECPYSPGVQSVDSQKGACPGPCQLEQLDTCRIKDVHRPPPCAKESKGCPLEVCKMRSAIHKSPVGSICTSPQSSHSNVSNASSSANNTKRVPFPTKRTDDEYAGGVVRWTEKCSQRCKRPTWNANRWNCDKPVSRGCVGCPGAHPLPSRCAQDFDSQRFGAIDSGMKPRKCDCCDRRYTLPTLPPAHHPHQMHSQFQHVDRAAQAPGCGCEGYARGINHARRSQPPIMMPQNPFDNNSSAYFNRLNKGMPFPVPPPHQAPNFSTLPPQPPPSFGSQINPPAAPPPFPPPPAPVINTVTTRDSSLNVLQDAEEFPSPLKSCSDHCLADQDAPPDHAPDQNVNIVSNPHMFNIFLPRNPNHAASRGIHRRYF